MLQIIPAIDLRSGRCVRLEQGDYNRQTTYDPSPVEMGRFWQESGARLIHIVDLDGAKDGRPANLAVVREITAAVSTPCELGGGIRDLDTAAACLDAGVQRIILGSALIDQPELPDKLLARFPADAVVAGLDAKNGKVAVHGWQSGSDRDVIPLAVDLVNRGIRHIIYTDIATDGMFTGPNLSAVEALCVACPQAQIIASGGVGTPEHVSALAGLKAQNLFGVIVGKALYDAKVSFKELVDASA